MADSTVNKIVDTVLRILREQRDDKQQQELHDTYNFNPQIFQYGNHFIAGPFQFKNAFQTTPSITFGSMAQKAIDDTTIASNPLASGYTPLVIFPYVYGFTQSTGQIEGFYMGLYSITPIPSSITKYTVSWHARGKGSAYAQHRIDEAWTSSYNKNEPQFLRDETGKKDPQ